MSQERDHSRSGFKIGDPFVYFSKYSKGDYATGVVEKIMEVTQVRGKNFEVNVKVFIINGIYEHHEIFHYEKTEGIPDLPNILRRIEHGKNIPVSSVSNGHLRQRKKGQ
jgi:hypothetical protein